jgi:hypothetical protein
VWQRYRGGWLLLISQSTPLQLGAGDLRRTTDRIELFHGVSFRGTELELAHQFPWRCNARNADRLVRQAHECLGQRRVGEVVVNGDVRTRAGRHFRSFRVGGMLHDRQSATSLYGLQSCSAVVEAPRQHDTDHTRSECDRSRAEQRIDRRSRVVLLRRARQADLVAGHQHVVVRRRHIEVAGFDGHSGPRVHRRIASASPEQFRKNASVRTDVLNQQYGSGHRDGQRGSHVEQHPHASGASADHDDVAARREHLGVSCSCSSPVSIRCRDARITNAVQQEHRQANEAGGTMMKKKAAMS